MNQRFLVYALRNKFKCYCNHIKQFDASNFLFKNKANDF